MTWITDAASLAKDGIYGVLAAPSATCVAIWIGRYLTVPEQSSPLGERPRFPVPFAGLSDQVVSTLHVLTVIGARPQFIKAAPLSRALRRVHHETLVHTGQHYDPGMSDVFFDELGIPVPDHHLGIGGGTHGAQTGAMLGALEQVIQRESPDVVLVYGDTNSTLAGALAAAKLRVPVAHVEAGLRSFNRAMPEEVNRVLTDHVATWLFAPSAHAARQLAREGLTRGVDVVGDIMYDAVLEHQVRAAGRSTYPASLGLESGEYYLCTVHRADNTDSRERLAAILCALARLGRPVVLPLHPRTRKQVEAFGLDFAANVRVLDPVGYLDMLQLQAGATAVLTDSGGLQKEAYYLGVPCVTMRDETEWVETVEAGWNRLTGASADRIVVAAEAATHRPESRPDLYGTGDTAGRIVAGLSRTVEG